MCHCANFYHVYNNNYNHNYPLVIHICLQHFCTYSLDLYSEDLFRSNATSHNTEWITTDSCLLCLAFKQKNILKVEYLYTRFLNKSIPTSWFLVHLIYLAGCVFPYVYRLFSCWCCCWFTIFKFDVFISVGLLQKVSCFGFQQSIVLHNVAIQNLIYAMYSIL